ncbi:MAG: DMT family transporter [Pseudomonadota bacterium]|nr:DMT family transporter [Pseudomonadota bacterium]
MPRKQVAVLTALAMIAFAGNSLLCRMALLHTGIDAASFTSIRLLSGALVLWGIVAAKGDQIGAAGSWTSALALFAYAAAFSFAYVSLSAATGALLLFGAVQTTMIGVGLWKGERFRGRQLAGLALAIGGLFALLLPGLSAPPLHAAALMLGAGFSWGIYSLRGKNAANPIQTTAGNFLRALPFAAALSMAMFAHRSLDGWGVVYAVASGALASGIGYAIWYTALRGLAATIAATVQLSVPVIAALGGVALLGETITARLLFTSIAILGGIWLIAMAPRASPPVS